MFALRVTLLAIVVALVSAFHPMAPARMSSRVVEMSLTNKVQDDRPSSTFDMKEGIGNLFNKLFFYSFHIVFLI